jgi:Ulp1 family protease
MEPLDGIATWTSHKDIFTKKFIFIPYNARATHWSLIVVVNPGSVGMKQSFCLILDSMQSSYNEDVSDTICQWLNAESKRCGFSKETINLFDKNSFPVFTVTNSKLHNLKVSISVITQKSNISS